MSGARSAEQEVWALGSADSPGVTDLVNIEPLLLGVSDVNRVDGCVNPVVLRGSLLWSAGQYLCCCLGCHAGAEVAVIVQAVTLASSTLADCPDHWKACRSCLLQEAPAPDADDVVMVHQPIHRCRDHRSTGEDVLPLAEGLVWLHQQGFALVAVVDQLQRHRGLQLAATHVGNIIIRVFRRVVLVFPPLR